MNASFYIIRRILFCIAVSVPIFISHVPVPSAQATTLVGLSDAQLVEFSSAICHATVTATRSLQMPDGTILTAVDIEGITWIKPEQNSDTTYTFYLRGGEINDIVQKVHGEPVIVPGQEVVVFLEFVARYQRPMLLGLAQGAFILDNDAAHGAGANTADDDGGQKIRSLRQPPPRDTERAVCRDTTPRRIKRAMRSHGSDFDTAQTPDELIQKIKLLIGRGNP